MQKIIVSNTSCIEYLAQINQLSLLQIIYGEIIIPETLNAEILNLEIKGHNLFGYKSVNRINVSIFPVAKNKNLFPSIKDTLDKVILLGCRNSNKLYNTALKSCNEL